MSLMDGVKSARSASSVWGSEIARAYRRSRASVLPSLKRSSATGRLYPGLLPGSRSDYTRIELRRRAPENPVDALLDRNDRSRAKMQ